MKTRLSTQYLAVNLANFIEVHDLSQIALY